MSWWKRWRFASTSRIDVDAALREEFLERILGFAPGAPVFISDKSSLCDFGDEKEVERLHGLIRSNFGVDASDVADANIAGILERIAARRASGA